MNRADTDGAAVEIPSRKQAMDAFVDAGGQVAAVFPIHYPRALLRAFGLLPVEVWGPPGRDPALGNTHLQTYTCSIVRCGLSFIKEGKLDHAAVVLVPHACDSLQGLGSVLLDLTETAFPVATFYLPRGRREADRVFVVRELKRLHDQLAAITGSEPGAEDVLRCARREEEADAALAELLRLRPCLGLSNRRFYEVVRAREYLPAETFTPLARQVTDAAGEAPAGGVRLVFSGLVPEPMEVLDLLDEAGVMISGDDMACAGRRCYGSGSSHEPLLRVAESLLDAPPDPTRGCTIEEHKDHLLALARRDGAGGVVHFDVKFCEPEQFYIPQVDRGLAAAGIKTLTVEVDLADPLPDQVATRLEALTEALS